MSVLMRGVGVRAKLEGKSGRYNGIHIDAWVLDRVWWGWLSLWYVCVALVCNMGCLFLGKYGYVGS